MNAPRDAGQALLVLVEEDRARRIAAIVGESERQSREALAAARAAARERVREALRAERRRLRQRLAAAEAELATARRRHETRRMAALLERGLHELEDRLVERWKDPAGREAWTRHVMDEARESFGAAAIAVEESPRAGLKARAGGNVIDGSVDGLLADREAVGARLLARLGGEG